MFTNRAKIVFIEVKRYIEPRQYLRICTCSYYLYFKTMSYHVKLYFLGNQRRVFSMLNVAFIALIHPIQWTIANSGRRDRPAKRQKKTSCVSTGQPVLTLCTRQVACRTSFLSRQSDVIASFSFGACSAARNLFVNLKIGYFVGYRCF